MSRISTVFLVLLILGLSPYRPASVSAGETREAVLKAKNACTARLKSGSPYEKVLMEDGTIIVCGKGEKSRAFEEREGMKTEESVPAGNLSACQGGTANTANLVLGLKSAGASDAAILTYLITLFHRYLNARSTLGLGHDETSDALFREIKGQMSALDWKHNPEWFAEGYATANYLVMLFPLNNGYYTYKTISFFLELLRSKEMEQGDRERIKERIISESRWILVPMPSSLHEGLSYEMPSKEELRGIAQILLGFLENDISVAKDFSDYFDSMRPSLSFIVPDLLPRFEEVSARGKMQEELEQETTSAAPYPPPLDSPLLSSP